jgi:hypothetical protein
MRMLKQDEESSRRTKRQPLLVRRCSDELCVIRENQQPDYAEEDNGDFEQLSIACARIQFRCQKGAAVMVGFVQGESATT